MLNLSNLAIIEPKHVFLSFIQQFSYLNLMWLQVYLLYIIIFRK